MKSSRRKIKLKKKIALHQTKITSRRDHTAKTKQRKPFRAKEQVVRGKEISISQSASPGQIVYGTMKIGGIFSFVDSSSDSKAYVVIESGDAQLAYQAKAGGPAGNAITIAYTVSGTNASNIVTVTGTAISIRLKSTGGTSTATAASVRDAVRADSGASALVSVNLGGGNGTGICAAESPTALTGGGGTWLHQVVTLACHEINAILELYLDNRLVTFGHSSDPRWGTGIWNAKVFMALNSGSDAQEAQPDLSAQLPTKWTSAHRQAGCAHAYIITIWNQNLFADGGQPEMIFKVQGKKVYDPRSGLTAFSSNAALIIADYLTNSKFGLGYSYSDIDTTALTAAANLCDETVSGEPRYTINGVFDTDVSWEQALSEMSAAIGGGDIVYQAGKWYIYPATWRLPTKTLSDSDLRGTMEIETSVSRSDKFNSVRGTFVNPNSNYNETDFPVVKNDTYITEDGAAVFEDIKYSLVTSHVTAQRLAKLELERVRQGISVVYPTHLGALELQIADTVAINNTRLGWASKTFEVRDVTVQLAEDGELTCLLYLRETGSGVFQWNNGYETTMDASPNSNLPDVTSIEAPIITLASGTSELYFRQDGTVFSRLKVSWPLSTNIYITEGGFYEVQFKLSTDAEWSQSTYVSGTQTFHHILDVSDGNLYDVRVRARNSFGFVSDWISKLGWLVVGKTAPPSDVPNFAAQITNQGIALSWTGIEDIDLDSYEMRYGSDWGSGTLIGNLRADGKSYLWQQLASGDYEIMIKALDTSGNYSSNESTQKVTIRQPLPVVGFTIVSLDGNVFLRWAEPVYPEPGYLPIARYKIYRGDTFAEAAQIAVISGTAHNHLEFVALDYIYWIEAVDIGGNVSSAVSQQVTTQTPPGYLPDFSHVLTTDGTITQQTYCVVGGDANAPNDDDVNIILPIGKKYDHLPGLIPRQWKSDLSTYMAALTAIGQTSFNYIFAGGDPSFLFPSASWPGIFETRIDYGSVLGPSIISFFWYEYSYGDRVRLVPTIAVSANNISYTTYAGASQVTVTGFRYAKFRFDIYPTTDSCVMVISKPQAEVLVL